ncbi:MAG: Uma2 family endonuclease [Cytophagales bacterium]|jgi:Uma2 family endonuclease|nr:Uma2 family endonuclease [Cytophagales bacterium]
MQLAVEIEKTFGKPTDEQFFQFCLANKGRLRIERDENGQILFLPLAGLETGLYNAGLTFEFCQWNRSRKLGKVFGSSAGFTLPDTSVKSPDVSWLSNEKWNRISEEERKRFAKTVPDFVLELRSASDELWELKRKMEKWLENGVQLGWLVDVQNEKTYVYRPSQEVEQVPFAQTLSGENVLPGFSINLKQFIENLT